MRIAVLVLAVVGGLTAGFLGLRWVSDAREAPKLLKMAEELGVSKEALAEVRAHETAGYLLIVSMLAAFGAAVASWRGEHKIAGGLLIGAALVPALFAAKSLVFTIFLLVAGGLSFAIKPGEPSLRELIDRRRGEVSA
jgi:hypothetical protein